jgi:GNAT superfamily N-acetyltransferase
MRLYSEIQHDASEPAMAVAARALLTTKNAFAVLAFEGQDMDPVGLLTLVECAAMYAGGRFGTIQELYIAPTKRNLGIGRLLLGEAKTIALECGWTRLEVTATAEHILPRSAKFYRQNGFADSGPRLKLSIT